MFVGGRWWSTTRFDWCTQIFFSRDISPQIGRVRVRSTKQRKSVNVNKYSVHLFFFAVWDLSSHIITNFIKKINTNAITAYRTRTDVTYNENTRCVCYNFKIHYSRSFNITFLYYCLFVGKTISYLPCISVFIQMYWIKIPWRQKWPHRFYETVCIN